VPASRRGTTVIAWGGGGGGGGGIRRVSRARLLGVRPRLGRADARDNAIMPRKRRFRATLPPARRQSPLLCSLSLSLSLFLSLSLSLSLSFFLSPSLWPLNWRHLILIVTTAPGIMNAVHCRVLLPLPPFLSLLPSRRAFLGLLLAPSVRIESAASS